MTKQQKSFAHMFEKYIRATTKLNDQNEPKFAESFSTIFSRWTTDVFKKYLGSFQRSKQCVAAKTSVIQLTRYDQLSQSLDEYNDC